MNQDKGQSDHLVKGLRKLEEAAEKVNELTSTAQENKKALAMKQQEADEALDSITKAMEKANEAKKEQEQLSGGLEYETKLINERKAKIEVELADIQPLVDEARKAVGSIRKSHLDELKSLKMPPPAIHDVLSGVLRMMGNYDCTWNSMKRFLSERSVIPMIVNFDARNINNELREEVQKLLRDKANSFEQSVIQKASLAAAPLATWVKALLKYSVILEKIAPLESDLYKATSKLEKSQKRLGECKETIDGLDKKVEKFKAHFSQKTQEAGELKIGLQKAEEILGQAQNLLSKLSGEKGR